jgi:hypothetical protein
MDRLLGAQELRAINGCHIGLTDGMNQGLRSGLTIWAQRWILCLLSHLYFSVAHE